MPIQDPFQEQMEKRLLLAMALSMVVLFLVPYVYHKVYPSPRDTQQTDPAVEEIAAAEPAPAPEKTAGQAERREQPEEPAAAAALQTVEVENRDLLLRWSNAGAVLESARLKKYHSPGGEPLEVVPQDLPALQGRPFSIKVEDGEANRRLAQALYQVRGVSGEKVQAPAEITFYYRDSVVEATRTIRIPEEGYVIELNSEVRVRRQPAAFAVLLGPGIGQVDLTAGEDFANPKAALYAAGSVERYMAEDLEEGSILLSSSPRWTAVDSKYFAYLVLCPGGLQGARVFRTGMPGQEGKDPTVLVGVEATVQTGEGCAVFIGPKDYEVLRSVDATLTSLIDYGWFTFLVRPLLFSLKFVYRYVDNYGWAIIILTFVINLALLPVRYKQISSMKKMAELQPQMKAIQEKYKKLKRGDPSRQKMNEEVMALYRKHGVNPLGGCLPLLIQFPFLIAFYQMLYYSIELRGAPFMGWIQDLSRPDPYYVTPLLMGVSMLAQQHMTPGSADPTQRRMMMLLPIVFTFFFLSFSSGLVLYFLFSNLFGMMFQLAIQKWNPELAPASGRKKTSRREAAD